MIQSRRTVVTGMIIAAVVIAIDQLTKWWIVENVMQPPRLIEITSFFNLVMAWNRGVSFGLFNNDWPLNAWVLPLIIGAIVVVLAVWLVRCERATIGWALGLVIGGAVGNLVDRVRYGAVADFLDFHAFGYHWPAFNVADSAITIGAVILILDSLLGRTTETKAHAVKTEQHR